MLKLLFAVSLAVLVFLILYGVMQRRVRPEAEIQKRLHGLTQDGKQRQPQRMEPESAPEPGAVIRRVDSKDFKELPFSERVWKPFLENIGNRIARLTPAEIRQLIQHRLQTAGRSHEWTPQYFLSVCLLGAISMTVFGVFMLQGSSYSFVQCVGMQVVLTAMGGYMPNLCLSIMIQQRQQQISHQLPEMLDLLCVSVQAGLSFDGALRKITERMHGPLIDECQKLQDDIRMGMVRRTAMRNMAERVGVQDVSLFLTSLIQAERLGTSMGKTLKNQADNIRERRRQYVKAEALKAPVKIVFPLVLFIFPAIFVIVLLPSLLSLMQNL